MASLKQTKLENSFSTGVKAKRLKPESVIAAQVPLPKESADPVSVDILEELRVIKSMLKDNAENMAAMREEISTVTKQLEISNRRVDQLESRIEKMEVDQRQCKKDHAELKDLQKRMEAYENYSRRCNVRILGMAEGSEGKDCVTFLENLLPNLFSISTKFPFEIERAHRIPVRQLNGQPRPRPIILKLLRFQHAIEILRLAKEKKKIEYKNSALMFLPDFAPKTAEKRKQFLLLRPQLQQLGARYGLFYPAYMRVTHDNHTIKYDDPVKLQQYIEGCENRME